ncbi:MAG: mechanosensitive ion channel [Pirellulaceae bacterium]|nr:mechanosensitive ion channel [Pirellulaceae bacterium]
MRGWKQIGVWGVLAALVGLAGVESVVGQPASPDKSSQPSSNLPAANGTALSEAERIARLQRSIDADQLRLDQLQASIDDPLGEYARADEAFKTLDQELADVKRELAAAQNAGRVLDVDVLRSSLAELEPRWAEARSQFQRAIEERKSQQASIATLENKLQQDREALDRLRGNAPEEAPKVPPPSSSPAAPGSASQDPSRPQPSTNGAADGNSGSQPAPPLHPLLSNPAISGGSSIPLSEEQGTPSKAATSEEVSPEVMKAQAEVASSSDDVRVAAEELQAIDKRVQSLDEDIANQVRFLAFAREKVESGEAALDKLNSELETKLAAGESIAEATRQLTAAQNGLLEAREEAQRLAIHIEELQHQREVLLGERSDSASILQQKEKAAEAASNELMALTNPWSLRNVLAWISDEGLKIAIILLVIGGVLWFARLLESRLVLLLTTTSRRGGRDERENRARTLVTVGLNTLRTVVVFVGGAMVLDQMGVPIGPILGGAAVVGVAVAFGAQSLIKDYFTGFMVLMEQQYMIGDVVRICGVDGQVEAITLRMTVLRDLEGRVHFIPHGQITTVTNLTHGWSRAVFDIPVAYKEDADRVMGVAMEICHEIKQDATFGLMIIDEPQMYGVDALGDSGVVIKFALKTRPLRQWEIKREMLRRIKRRFDELGIEIPFPHRTLYVRSEDGLGGAEQLLAERFASRNQGRDE